MINAFCLLLWFKVSFSCRYGWPKVYSSSVEVWWVEVRSITANWHLGLTSSLSLSTINYSLTLALAPEWPWQATLSSIPHGGVPDTPMWRGQSSFGQRHQFPMCFAPNCFSPFVSASHYYLPLQHLQCHMRSSNGMYNALCSVLSEQRDWAFMHFINRTGYIHVRCT